MSLTFPLTGLMDSMKIAQATFNLDPTQETSTQASGRTIGKDLAPSLWHGKFQTMKVPHAEALQYQALLNALRGVINTFYAFNPMGRYPQSDPDGSILGSSTVKINSLGSDNKSLSLKGLPHGYVLTIGDFLSYDYTSGSTSRAFHQIVESATANGSGVTPSFEVVPNIRPGAATNLVVSLAPAQVEMFLVPGSVPDLTNADRFKSVVTFEAKQKLY